MRWQIVCNLSCFGLLFRNEDHDTCPICREKLESPDDTWVLSDVPKAEEISQEIRTTLMDLAEDKSPPCSPS